MPARLDAGGRPVTPSVTSSARVVPRISDSEAGVDTRSAMIVMLHSPRGVPCLRAESTTRIVQHIRAWLALGRARAAPTRSWPPTWWGSATEQRRILDWLTARAGDEADLDLLVAVVRMGCLAGQSCSARGAAPVGPRPRRAWSATSLHQP